MDAEAFVQAYVNIVAGACISLGKTWFSCGNDFLRISFAYTVASNSKDTDVIFILLNVL